MVIYSITLYDKHVSVVEETFLLTILRLQHNDEISNSRNLLTNIRGKFIP